MSCTPPLLPTNRKSSVLHPDLTADIRGGMERVEVGQRVEVGLERSEGEWRTPPIHTLGAMAKWASPMTLMHLSTFQQIPSRGGGPAELTMTATDSHDPVPPGCSLRGERAVSCEPATQAGYEFWLSPTPNLTAPPRKSTMAANVQVFDSGIGVRVSGDGCARLTYGSHCTADRERLGTVSLGPAAT